MMPFFAIRSMVFVEQCSIFAACFLVTVVGILVGLSVFLVMS